MLLFLHGFLGQKEDWDPLFTHLPPSLMKRAIDLPGHGTTPFSPNVLEVVHKMAEGSSTLVGYSAGGRIALALREKYPKVYTRVIALSTNLGTLSPKEQAKRLATDKEWARKLREEPFDQFLETWYNQPLFHSLRSHPHFPEMLARRKKQDPSQLAAFLETFSVAKNKPPEIFQDTFFLFGKEDLKYARLYRKLAAFSKIFAIPNASHAIHLESAKQCSETIGGIIDGNM